MRRIPIAAFSLILLVGCAPQRHVIDVTRIDGHEDFDWNGRMIVTEGWKGLLGGGYKVDLIKLEGRDGRSILIDTRYGVKAYVEVEVERLKPGAKETIRGPNPGVR